MAFDTLASTDIVEKTIAGLAARNVEAVHVSTRDMALAEIKKRIPQGATVMNGASETLSEVGYIDYLKAGAHGWNNLHEGILAEKDPAKQAELRRQASLSEYYVGSMHAVTEDGQMFYASNTGSQLPHLVYTSQNLILVVGTQKIVPTLADAFQRLEEYIVPLENVRMQKVYGANTNISKIVILKDEPAFMGRKVVVIFVDEKLGF